MRELLGLCGFESGEIDSGGFFSGTIGIIAAVGRFFAFATVGIGLGDVPAFVQVLFSAWSVFMLMVTIALLLSAFWDG